jgi:hypothetical protein
MPNSPMHWCTCRINLSGQNLHIIVIGPHAPVTWPEVQVLSLLHGEDNLYDIKPCAISDVNPADEKRRLWAKYGDKVERVFPGRVFRMELQMPGEGLDHRRVDGDGIAIADMRDASAGPEYGPDPYPGGEAGPGPAVFKPGRPRPSQPMPSPGPSPPSPSSSSLQRQ